MIILSKKKQTQTQAHWAKNRSAHLTFSEMADGQSAPTCESRKYCRVRQFSAAFTPWSARGNEDDWWQFGLRLKEAPRRGGSLLIGSKSFFFSIAPHHALEDLIASRLSPVGRRVLLKRTLAVKRRKAPLPSATRTQVWDSGNVKQCCHGVENTAAYGGNWNISFFKMWHDFAEPPFH